MASITDSPRAPPPQHLHPRTHTPPAWRVLGGQRASFKEPRLLHSQTLSNPSLLWWSYTPFPQPIWDPSGGPAKPRPLPLIFPPQTPLHSVARPSTLSSRPRHGLPPTPTEGVGAPSTHRVRIHKLGAHDARFLGRLGLPLGPEAARRRRHVRGSAARRRLAAAGGGLSVPPPPGPRRPPPPPRAAPPSCPAAASASGPPLWRDGQALRTARVRSPGLVGYLLSYTPTRSSGGLCERRAAPLGPGGGRTTEAWCLLASRCSV